MAGCAAAAAVGSCRGDVHKLMFESLHGYGLLCWLQRDQTVISLGLNFSINLFVTKLRQQKHVKGSLPDGPAVWRGGISPFSSRWPRRSAMCSRAAPTVPERAELWQASTSAMRQRANLDLTRQSNLNTDA